MFKKSIFIFIPLFILGCTSTEIRTIRLSPNIQAKEVVVKTHLTPKKTTAHVGEIMLTTGEFSKEISTIKSETFSIFDAKDIDVQHVKL